jgi:hypothetical protein
MASTGFRLPCGRKRNRGSKRRDWDIAAVLLISGRSARPAAQQRPFFACPGGQKFPLSLESMSMVAGFTLTDGPSTRALQDASSARMSAAESNIVVHGIPICWSVDRPVEVVLGM